MSLAQCLGRLTIVWGLLCALPCPAFAVTCKVQANIYDKDNNKVLGRFHTHPTGFRNSILGYNRCQAWALERAQELQDEDVCLPNNEVRWWVYWPAVPYEQEPWVNQTDLECAL